GGELGSAARRRLAPLVGKIPSLGTKITAGVTPTLRTSSFVRRPVLSRGLAGTLCPNAIVAGGRRLDDIAPDRFLIVTSVEPTDDQRFEITRRGAFVVVAPAGSTLG